MREVINNQPPVMPMSLYLNIAIHNGNATPERHWRVLPHVELAEAIGILDPFQRWDDAQCMVCGEPNSDTYNVPGKPCRKSMCWEAMYSKVGE